MKYILLTETKSSKNHQRSTSSSIGVLLQSYGYNITYLKINPYLNYNAGRMRPSVHGEIYVLDDGGEVDLDLGNFERYCSLRLDKTNFLTAGKILYDLISTEKTENNKNGELLTFSGSFDKYLKDYIINLSDKYVCSIESENVIYKKPDIMLIELAGKDCDEEFSLCAKSLSKFYKDLPENDRCLILTNYIALDPHSNNLIVQPPPKCLLNPDIIICSGASNTFTTEVIDRIDYSSFFNKDNIFFYEKTKSKYEIPKTLFNLGVYTKISQKLGLSNIDQVFKLNQKFQVVNTEFSVLKRIGVITRYKREDEPYISLFDVLVNAGKHLGCEIEIVLIDYIKLYEKDPEVLSILHRIDGILMPGGFGDGYTETKIDVAKYSRTHNIPCLGICLGFQIQLIEFARNVLNIKDATSKEFSKEGTYVINSLDCVNQKLKKGYTSSGKERVILKGQIGSKLYKSTQVDLKFRHSYCFDNKFLSKMEENGLNFLASGICNKQVIFSLTDHKFYMGVQYHPELSSTPDNPDPIIMKFIESVRYEE